MRNINIVLPTLTFSSFAYVGRIVKMLFENFNTNTVEHPANIVFSTNYRRGFLNLRIDDLALTLREGRFSDVAWLDTALNLDKIHSRVKTSPARIYVCGCDDKRKCEEKGVKVEGVIPRPFNPIAYMFRNMKYEKKYDVMVIGWYIKPDRKNFRFADEIVRRLNLKAVAITNYRCVWERYDFSSLDDFAKFRLLSKSKYLLQLSGREGFGMPVLEAMAVGTPVIYLDAPVHNEFAVGFKIPARESEIIKLSLGNCTVFKPDIGEALDVVKQALDVYGTNRYFELSCLAMSKADKILADVIGWLRSLL